MSDEPRKRLSGMTDHDRAYDKEPDLTVDLETYDVAPDGTVKLHLYSRPGGLFELELPMAEVASMFRESSSAHLEYKRRRATWRFKPELGVDFDGVWVPHAKLEELLKTVTGDAVLLDRDAARVLLARKLAVRETRGGYHAGPALPEFMAGLQADPKPESFPAKEAAEELLSEVNELNDPDGRASAQDMYEVVREWAERYGAKP
jgi:hypothetical protein